MLAKQAFFTFRKKTQGQKYSKLKEKLKIQAKNSRIRQIFVKYTAKINGNEQKTRGNNSNSKIKDETIKTLKNGYSFKAKISSFLSFQTFPQNSRGKNSRLRQIHSVYLPKIGQIKKPYLEIRIT